MSVYIFDDVLPAGDAKKVENLVKGRSYSPTGRTATRGTCGLEGGVVRCDGGVVSVAGARDGGAGVCGGGGVGGGAGKVGE